MTAIAREEPLTIPPQAGAVEPPPAPEPVLDHVRAHPMSCYWDLTTARWVCGA